MENKLSQNRTVNLDILKAFCAFFVVAIHAPFPGEFGRCFETLCRIAVPIFFMITGYFYSDVVKRGREVNQLKKIFILLIEANVIYVLWKLFVSLINGNFAAFNNLRSLLTWRNFLFFNESPFRSHLWYLGAVLYVLIIVFLADKIKIPKIWYKISIPVLLLCNFIFGEFALLVFGRKFGVYIPRNFLFMGLPFFCIGYCVKNGFGKRIKKNVLWFSVFLFSALSIVERYALKSIGIPPKQELYISTVFCAVSVFLLALNSKPCEKMKFAAVIGRKYCTWCYILHLVVLSTFGMLLKNTPIYGVYKYVMPVVVFAVTILLLAAVYKIKEFILSKRAVKA